MKKIGFYLLATYIYYVPLIVKAPKRSKTIEYEFKNVQNITPRVSSMNEKSAFEK